MGAMNSRSSSRNVETPVPEPSKLDDVNLARRVAAGLPQPFVNRLNRAQFEHPSLGRVLRAAASRVARGEGVIANGPAAGLRIDATGFHAGYVLGTSDYPEQQWLTKALKPGSVFVDVGAAIGFFSLLAARIVGPQGAVVAFEPFPENATRLRKNALLNHFANLEVNQAAVADVEGAANFTFAPGRWFGGSLSSSAGSDDSLKAISGRRHDARRLFRSAARTECHQDRRRGNRARRTDGRDESSRSVETQPSRRGPLARRTLRRFCRRRARGLMWV